MAAPSQAGARPLSATDAWLGVVAGDETYVGTIRELIHQVHDRACNSAAAVPIVTARSDAARCTNEADDFFGAWFARDGGAPLRRGEAKSPIAQ
jgi:hypothetical protein